MKKVLLFCLIVTLVCCAVVPVFAKEDAKTNGYNVVIAMDASGSLKETDPNNFRLSAVNLFIQLLANDTNKLGCISFSTDASNQKKLTAIRSVSDKQAVYDYLKTTAESEVAKSGWTNIGSALQGAVSDIITNGDSDIPSVILLLSDGNTELATEKETQVSLDAKADAVQAARDHNIAIYSVCLNANGEADKKEMEQISKATGGKAVEIKKAEDLQDVLTTFYSMIYGTSVQTIVDNTFDSKGLVEIPFDVPGTGVDEINIIIYGKAKDIVITRQDKTVANYDVIESEAFSFLKITDIIPGQWCVTLSGVPGDKVKIDLLFNTDLSILTSIEPNKESFNPDDIITVEARLSSNSKYSNEEDPTKGFTATLQWRDKYGEVTEEIPMSAKNGAFVAEKQFPEGTYKYSVLVEGYNISKESEIKGPIAISSEIDSQAKLTNKPPAPVEDPVKVKINLWPFKENVYSLDVSEMATDDQEEPLEYRIESSSYIEGDDYSFDGKTLVMSGYSLSKGEFVFDVYDKFGESCQLTLRIVTRNIGLLTVIILAVAALAAVALVLFFTFRNKILFFTGTITVQSQQTWQIYTEEHPGKGQYKLSRFVGLDDIGLDYRKTYFQATGGKHVFLCTNKPISCGGAKTTKKLRMENGREYRVFLPAKNGEEQLAITVRFDSRRK